MSQLNFFMTKDEVVEKIKSLNIKNQFVFFQGRFFDTKKPIPLVDMQDVGKSQDLIIWVRNPLKEPECSIKGLGDYSDKFLFDYYKDPVIEFSNCQYKSKLISSGRIYYKAGWIDNAELRELHRKMAAKIIREFGKGLTTVSAPFKISKKIKNLILSGYEIELGYDGFRMNASNI